MEKLRYGRVMLKLSGEALAGEQGFGIEPQTIQSICRELVEAASLGVQLSLVIGGGNIFRGVSVSSKGMDRASADYMGMLATVMNALAVQDALEKLGVTTRVMTAIDMKEVAEPYIRRRAIRHLEKGRVVICGAGTGNPYFTTDSAAALRASEIDADVLLKGTKVDGIYSADPMKDPKAKRFKDITYTDALSRQLKVMDAAAFSLCMEKQIPIIVFNFFKKSEIIRVLRGEPVGTLVHS